MANTLSELELVLRANIAQLREDLGKANQLAQQSAKEMSRAMREQSERAKDSVDVLSDVIGVRLPRELKKVLGDAQVIAPVMATAFSAVAAAGFAAVIAEQIVPALMGTYDWMRGVTEELKKANEEAVKLNNELLVKAPNESVARSLLNETNRRIGEAEKARDLLTNNGKENPMKLTDLISSAATSGELGVANYIAQYASVRDLDAEILRLQSLQAKQLERVNELVKEQAKEQSKVKSANTAYATQLDTAAKQVADAMQKSQMATASAADKINLDVNYRIDQLREILAKYPQLWQQVNSVIAQLNLERQQKLHEIYAKEEADLKEHLDKMMQEAAKQKLSEPNLGLNLPTTTTATPTLAPPQQQQKVSDLKKLYDELFNVKSMTEILDKSFENWALDMTLNSKGVADSFASMAKSIISSIAAMIAKMLAMYAVQKLIGLFLPGATNIGKSNVTAIGGSGGYGIGATSGPIWSTPPFHDYPGYAVPNQPYRVGVPEVFIPNGGMAIPLSQFKGSGSNQNVFIDATGSNDPAATEAAVMRAMKKFYPMSVQASLIAQQERAYRR